MTETGKVETPPAAILSGQGPVPALDVVIVNYRTGPLVVDCLESLAQERGPGMDLRVCVIDNASPDGSAAVIEQAVAAAQWEWVRVIRSPTNGGFGAGNNMVFDLLAAAAENGDRRAGIVWLLNPDTRVIPGSARALVAFMAQRPSAGIVGTALLDGHGTPWPYAFRFPTILGELERGLSWALTSRLLARFAIGRRMGDSPQRVDWVSGASFAIRRALLDEGLRFDEKFFLYYEETDFCRMARREGWETWYLPQAEVLHIAGQSTGVTAKDGARRRMPSYWFASRQYYFVKNYGRAYAVLADLAWMAAHFTFRMKQRLRKERYTGPPWLLRDFARHCALFPRRGSIARSG